MVSVNWEGIAVVTVLLVVLGPKHASPWLNKVKWTKVPAQAQEIFGGPWKLHLLCSLWYISQNSWCQGEPKVVYVH
jgi:hypothetical protein